MISHHPDDDLLLALAAGGQEPGAALVLRAHLETCPHCRARLGVLEAVGGALLDAVEPALLEPEALARTLARLDRPEAADRPALRPARRRPELPEGVAWPASLRECAVSGWRWMGPGMAYSRVRLPHDPAAALFLLRIGAGRELPRHTHGRLEFTQVLCGEFDDGRGVFGPGDFDAADGDVRHQPAVRASGVCVCLAYVSDGLVFEGRVASLIGGLIGM